MNGNNRYTPNFNPDDQLTMLEMIFVQNLAFEAGYDSTKIPIVDSGSGVPATTPDAIGSIYVDTLNGDIYMAVGTTNSADWLQVNGGGAGGAVDSVNSQTGVVVLDANDVGAIPASEKGAANGVAELDAGGLVPSSQLPSYVDDVIEVANFAALPGTGEVSKIYVTLDTNLTYRWTGTVYVEISASLALGETSATAYRGDRGKIAYDYSQVGHLPLAGGTLSGDLSVPDEAYDATTWNGNNEVPTKNAIRDKIESLSTGSGISEELAIAYAVAL